MIEDIVTVLYWLFIIGVAFFILVVVLNVVLSLFLGAAMVVGYPFAVLGELIKWVRGEPNELRELLGMKRDR